MTYKLINKATDKVMEVMDEAGALHTVEMFLAFNKSRKTLVTLEDKIANYNRRSFYIIQKSA